MYFLVSFCFSIYGSGCTHELAKDSQQLDKIAEDCLQYETIHLTLYLKIGRYRRNMNKR